VGVRTARHLRAADGIHFSEGAWWAERQVGTNALGTSLEVAAPIQIRSAEHFTTLVQPWSCAAAPIYDPDTQRLLGVVDITGGVDASSPQSLALVRAAARMAEASPRSARSTASATRPPHRRPPANSARPRR
jgi:transcriptional regulator of acetoin/glycerol metabolism